MEPIQTYSRKFSVHFPIPRCWLERLKKINPLPSSPRAYIPAQLAVFIKCILRNKIGLKIASFFWITNLFLLFNSWFSKEKVSTKWILKGQRLGWQVLNFINFLSSKIDLSNFKSQ